MTPNESKQYWYPAALAASKYLPIREHHDEAFSHSRALARLLGMDYPYYQTWYQIELTPELKDTLLALSGPHTQTIIKMIQAKKETE